MKSITGIALFAAIALCAFVSACDDGSCDDELSLPVVDYTTACCDSDDGDLDIDIDITLTIDLVEITTIIFNTIYSLLLPLLIQLLPLVINFLELLLY